jgi:hypothetical protein
VGVALTVLGLGAACTGATPTQGQATVSGDGSVAAADQGEQLSKEQAAVLEQTLQATPDDLSAQEQLVGYYFIATAFVPSSSQTNADPNSPPVARDRHLVWLIQHAPALQLLGTSPLGVVQPKPDAAGYAAAKAAWSLQLAGQAPAQVKGNAGIFFAQTDDPQAEDLLAAAEAGDGQNATWPGALADLYARRARTSAAGSQVMKQAAVSAVSELEKAWNLGGSSNSDPMLSQIAKLAVVAGEDDKAVQYATVLVNTFKLGSGQSPLSVGGPIHDGNMVLGQVALHRGDRAGAEQYLVKAGASPGSPQMDQFGPNFSLARDLLAVRSTDVVLMYCDEVAKFWSDPKLATWRAAIAAGQTPNFGDNLWV